MELLFVRAVTSVVLLIATFYFTGATDKPIPLESFTEVTAPICKFSYKQAENDTLLQRCFEPIKEVQNISSGNIPVLGNGRVIIYSVTPTVNIHKLDSSKIWKSKVDFPTHNRSNFDNVGEPSFASNGSLMFYTGNRKNHAHV